MKTQDILMPAFQYTDAKYATAHTRESEDQTFSLGDELIRPEQILGHVPTFPLDCR